MSNPTTPFSWQMPQSTDLVTDLPADFEVFGQAVATSMADLLGGTTGQILSKTSATDMDFTWIANDQGDITGITATSPLTGGGSSGAITVGIQDATTSVKGSVQLSDSTSTTSSVLAATPTAVKSAYDLADGAIPKTLTTTTGDVIYASAANTPARLGIGSTSQVLTVTGGVPVWATPAGGSGGMTLLDTVTLSGASVTSASLSGSYKNLQVIIKNQKDNTSDSVQLRCNNDANTSYFWAGYYANNASGTNSFTTYTSTNSGRAYFAIAYVGGGTTTNGDQMVINIYRYTDTGATLIQADSVFLDSGTLNRMNVTGIYKNSSAITSITLLMASGSFSSGTAYIYGVS